jgi:hypothetical protein
MSGPGASAMKGLSPFFDESILFYLGFGSSYGALLVDSEALMSLLLSRDLTTIKFVRDVFGPKKSEFYFNFTEAQRLIRTPSVGFQHSFGLVSYLMPRVGPLIDVVQLFFGQHEAKLQDMVNMEGENSTGSFSVKQLVSYAKESLMTDVRFSDVAKKMEKPEYLYSCQNQISTRHCPYMSLRTPTNPFWKRVMRVKDIYISFIGSSALHLGGPTKYSLIMEHLGPETWPFVYRDKGSFVVFEVYSKVKGFGPCSGQGMFYLLLVQDPKTLA